MDNILILSAYGPKPETPGLDCSNDPGKTQQNFKDECDINVLMARYEKTGILPMSQKGEPAYLDVTGIEFRTSMEILATARSAFAQLPAHLRARFDNDPAKLLDFVHDPDNRDEAARLGLLKPELTTLDPETGEIIPLTPDVAPATSQPAPEASTRQSASVSGDAAGEPPASK